MPLIRLDSPEHPGDHPGRGTGAARSTRAAWTLPPQSPRRLLVGTSRGATLDGRPIGTWLDGLHFLDQERRTPGACWAGYFAYELGYHLEPAAGAAPEDDSAVPLYVWGECDASMVTEPSPAPPAPTVAVHRVHSRLPRPAYLDAARRCLDYIAAGDVFQINLSQQLYLHTAAEPAEIYNALLASGPARYGALLDFREPLGFAAICDSPELFLRVEPDGRIWTRPIKGTRPRQPGMEPALLDSSKDAAELNMIVDLERNDLGRVCETGSVVVSQPRAIEEHPSVLHGVASIEGNLRDGVGLLDVLAATFPSGSVTGAPKIRAMQIIDELEPDARGVYCGAVGHLDPDGSMQFNVAIRTATLANGVLEIPVGGGIVADSDPAAEFDETLVKAAALLAAAGAG